ncbi:MAG: BON domain-containing protein [Nitrospira sp. BO4]|jgi:osmotically-inducible protein OsmY|nr:BON domain-containing protein [Nitrospira sp. BO4]
MNRKLNGVVAVILVVLSTWLVGFVGDVTKTTDLQIESAIRERLASDGRIDAKNIQVNVDQGVVNLTGTVPDLESKGLAEALVSGTIVGVRQLHNEITVVPPVVKDEMIRKSIEAALRSVPALRDNKTNTITVLVHEGDVVLKGAVEKPLHSRLAYKTAQTVPGVVSIANLLKVVGEPRPDRDLEKDVMAYLKWAPFVDLDQVEYSIEKGVIKLKGKIEHHAGLVSLVNDLEKIRGVVDVDVSEMTVTKTQQKG